MKKLMFVLMFIFGLATFATAQAGPFLTCDCTPATDNITGFQLQFGTAAWIDVAAAASCSTNVCTGTARTVCYDLASLPNGAFTVKGRAKNAWGVSADSLPFSDTKGTPGTIQNLRRIP